MGKEKGSRVFFEVYRKQMKEEPLPEQKPPLATAGALDDIGKIGVASSDAEDAELRNQEPGVGSQESPPPSQGGDRGGVGLGTRREAWQQRVGLKRDEVYIRQDTLIYAALGAVFLSVGCFFIGHKLGYDKGRKAEPVKQVSVGSTKGNALPKEGQELGVKESKYMTHDSLTRELGTQETIQSQPIASKEEKWTLRVVSYNIGDQNTKKASELARTIQKEIGHDAFVAKTSQELVVCVGKFDNKDSSELLTLQKELRDFKYENKKQFKGCYPVRLR